MERKLAIDNLRVVQFEGETLADIWLVLDGAYSTRDIGAMKEELWHMHLQQLDTTLSSWSTSK